MAQTNFILTDIMKTGDHLATEGFIKLNNLPNQKFEMTGEYYTLHQFNLSQFDRKIALLDVKHRNQRLQGNKDFDIELKNRIVKLEKLGFKMLGVNDKQYGYVLTPILDINMHKSLNKTKNHNGWYVLKKHNITIPKEAQDFTLSM